MTRKEEKEMKEFDPEDNYYSRDPVKVEMAIKELVTNDNFIKLLNSTRYNLFVFTMVNRKIGIIMN